jgi:hypothetical protein
VTAPTVPAIIVSLLLMVFISCINEDRKIFLASLQEQLNHAMTSYFRIFTLLFAFVGVVITFNLATIKPRFPQQFIATISDDHSQRYYSYPCLYDSINRREKCQLNNNGVLVNRIRNFSNNTFTETNYTTQFPSKCNISNTINNAKLLDPNWFDKLNLSLASASTSQYIWIFTLKKPLLLEELPFAPKFLVQQNQYDQRTPQIPFNKIRNIVGEIYTSDPDFTWPKSMSLSFDTPGYECPREYRDRNQSCRQGFSWTFTKQSSFGMVDSGAASVGDMFDVLFTVPSFLPPCQNIDNQNVEQEEEEDEEDK